MMTRRKRITILAAVFILFLLVLIWLLWWLFGGDEDVQDPIVDVEVENRVDTTSNNPTISQQELETERETRTVSADVVSLSKTFVTRYGSYSNEADFANLVDVLPLMTDRFAQETQEFIESTEAPEEYYGVTTRIVTVQVEEKTDEIARVLVNTQREESMGSPQNIDVRYQSIQLQFLKESGQWRVDSATWL